MYSEEQYYKALEVYEETKSIIKTMRLLGYPARRQTLYNWINRKRLLPENRTTFRGYNTAEHPRHPPLELKLDVIRRCFENGEDVQSVSNEVGYSTASIYAWRRKYILKGSVALMNSSKERKRGKLSEGEPASSPEIEDLKAQLSEMRLEIDILNETINVLKKDPGVDLTSLRNREKAVIIGALKSKYSLPILLKRLSLSKSSYYYQISAINAKDKYAKLRDKITNLFHNNRDIYGYRRIHTLLYNEGFTVSEKVIRRIMKEEGLMVKQCKRLKYSSYKGEITPAANNLINRDFHADKPNEKWLTDITEFSIKAGKVYLSPIIDCFDGKPIEWTIGTSPNAQLVNTMLQNAIITLKPNEQPIVHSDRGCHYRWPEWISMIESAGLTRSMSKKGCSPDNSACEGFFGHLKTEMFYGRNWDQYTIEEFIQEIDDYMHWYCERRIKSTLGGLSPLDYRRRMGVAV
ncbi:MAG: IS3 family transposase [Clostridia bacterium]|nr:IS3 family transposase [Clostridia bacterium]